MNLPPVNHLYSDIPDYLAWQSDLHLPVEASTLHRQWMTDRLRAWAHFGGAGLLDTMRSLPQTARQRVMASPLIFNLLRNGLQPDQQDFNHLTEILKSELDLSTNGTAEKWTALGDHYFPPAADGLGHETSAEDEHCALRERYDAPVVDGIVLDTHSFVSKIMLKKFHSEPHTPEEMQLIGPRVKDALDYVKATSPAAAALVKSSIRVLAVGKSTSEPNTVGSNSWSPFIGVSGLINMHIDKWNVSRIAEALVHESIHGMLYKFELSTPFYTNEDAADRVKTVSPWTHRSLALHSFTHACFVWYGLWQFFGLTSLGPRERQQFLKARNGFFGPGPLDGASEEVRESIQPCIRSAIYEMTRRVTRTQDSIPIADVMRDAVLVN